MRNDVKKIRAKLNFAQKDLAIKCNVSRQTIHAIESSKYQPTVTLALKISKALGAKVEEIFFLERGD